MKITIDTIAHKNQRYDTIGDWQFDANEDLTITVSKLSDWRREALIAVHELVEVLLCKHAGITQETVDKFDMSWIPKGEEEEAGDDPKAPYVKQHCIATGIERMLAAELGVSWKDYEDELYSL